MGCQSEVTIGDYLTFSICTHDPDTGALTDADSAPAYRVYEDETATAILTGTMTKLDDVNTLGFYTERIECSAGNGFEDGKSYTIYIEATVDSDTGGIAYAFRAVTLSAATIADAVLDEAKGAHTGLLAKALPDAAPDAAGGLPISDAGGLDLDAILADTNELQTDDIPGKIAALNDLSAAEVNAEVVDALNTDTYAEPGQGAPAATASLAAKIGYLYKAFRNKLTQTATTLSIYNDAGAVVDQKATVSDDATTFTRGEIGTGP